MFSDLSNEVSDGWGEAGRGTLAASPSEVWAACAADMWQGGSHDFTLWHVAVVAICLTDDEYGFRVESRQAGGIHVCLT